MMAGFSGGPVLRGVLNDPLRNRGLRSLTLNERLSA